ncbi:hypothetical protein HHK36_020946 [Tetracentron sinense]|uniref:S-adenosylmethionine synthase n=1 Tax=Tetracentron sinense TaxID=13715 RepID=A0A835DC30_TETSI|nr:hypothetical protein HHK36_020946 [Tetracentron sinense]
MDDSCAVCAETLEWVAYGACGHREVCSTCVARLRFICDDRRCCICKTESQVVFITKGLGDYTRAVNDFSIFPSDSTEGQVGSYWYHEDTQAYFDDSDHYKMIKAMCRLSCSVCDKMEEQGNDGPKRRWKFRNIGQLKSHLFHQHRLLMCSLCLEGRKIHFRRDHFLCEDEACLAKKFIVFQSETEMKRHNTIEHGGQMSRSKRNAALQIPTSFRYRRSNEQDHSRGRGQRLRPDSSANQLLFAIQASFEMANAESAIHDPSSNAQVVFDHGDRSGVDEIVEPFESLATTDSEQSSRYLEALGQNSRNTPLEESFFPPLPMAPGSSQHKPNRESEWLAKNSMTEESSFPPLPMAPGSSQHKPNSESDWLAKNSMSARLRRNNNGTATILNSAQAWSARSHESISSSNSSDQSRPTINGPLSSSNSAISAVSKPVTANGPISSTYASSVQTRPAKVHGLVSTSSASSSWNSSITGGFSHSASAPNLVDRGSFESSISNFPPVSATQKQISTTSSQPLLNVEDINSANKYLVEKIRAALEFDEDKYIAFKDISAEYRHGLIDTGEYLSYVQQFGLSHLILELSRLCPNAQKQKELVETHNASMRGDGPRENGWGNSGALLEESKGSKKGIGKCVDDADSVISTVRKLQSGYKPLEEEVEVLSKGGYRSAKGKSKLLVFDEQTELSSASRPLTKPRGQNDSQSAVGGSNQNSRAVGGVSNQRKKNSKFHKVRLGDGSMAALLDRRHSDPDPTEERTDDDKNSSEGLPVHGVWRNGGGNIVWCWCGCTRKADADDMSKDEATRSEAVGMEISSGEEPELERMETFLFTSESVNEGHPDKLCDQISDAVLDACLAQDPDSKVACETCTKTNMVMVFGEITTKADINYEKIVRDTCRSIGFVSDDVGLDADNCKVLVNIEQQSPDIAQGVHGHLTKRPEEIGAGDQGLMFGYATDETPELMPLSHVLATKLGARLTEVRKNGTCSWLRPDGKTQVTVEYHNDKGAMVPIRVHTVLISTQHDETVTNDEIAADLKEHVIKPVIPEKYLDEKTIFHLNPSGRFVIGGPHGDAGLTGRKIIIDTYGGWGAHGGGAFSGKDPTKVDRSGAYIVRQAAKSIVASGLARRCIVQVSYAIGVPEPLSVFVETYGTGKIPDKEILKIVKESFDFRPGMISINLDLKRGGNGRFLKTAAYGHFGRDDPDFTWEVVIPLKWEKA